MCIHVNGCCCLKNNKDGSFATGIYTGFVSLLSVMINLLILKQYQDSFDANPVTQSILENELFLLRISILSSVVWNFICFLLCFAILYGIIKKKTVLIFIWLIWMVVVIVGQLTICILFFIFIFNNKKYELIGPILFSVFIATFYIYCYACVYSYYRELTRSNEDNTSLESV